MKSLITLKVSLGLLSAIVIPVVVLVGITQTYSVETQRKGLAKGSEFEQGKVLESKDGSRRSPQNSSASNVINHPIDNSQSIRTCNMKFSSCPISY